MRYIFVLNQKTNHLVLHYNRKKKKIKKNQSKSEEDEEKFEEKKSLNLFNIWINVMLMMPTLGHF